MKRKFISDSSGVALVELSLLIILVLNLGIGLFEITRALRFHKIAINVSREAANTIYRECGSVGDFVCISHRYEQINYLLNKDAPNSTLIISVFESDGNSDYSLDGAINVTTPQAPTRSLTNVSFGDNFMCVPSKLCDPLDELDPVEWRDPEKRYSQVSDGVTNAKAVNVNYDSGSGISPKDHQLMVVAEVYIPFNPIVSFIASKFGWRNGMFYDFTLI